MSGDYETHKNQQPHVSYAGNKVDLDKYALFVDGVTSNPSKDYQSILESLSALDGEGSNIHRLLTAAVGISAEGGCLLYTSPSPRDGLLSRMPSSA